MNGRGYLSELASAGVTQLVECNLAKVDVASSSLVTRSIRDGAARAARSAIQRLERASNASAPAYLPSEATLAWFAVNNLVTPSSLEWRVL
jgi:hypothetical protein